MAGEYQFTMKRRTGVQKIVAELQIKTLANGLGLPHHPTVAFLILVFLLSALGDRTASRGF
jgi:hypothetical protein